ncbi:diguanylate phosphodiesterase, partial [Pseudomonas syringae pv. actinidiae]|nr:diguanylate phosphodiesterase [Pseudomonas syringae pv. actinidiae]
MLIRQGGGITSDYWALRMAPDALKDLAASRLRTFSTCGVWSNARRNGSSSASRCPPMMQTAVCPKPFFWQPLSNSDWQLRGLFDTYKARSELLTPLIGKCVIGLLLSILPLIALISLRRRQRQMLQSRRRYRDIFEGAGVAICVMDMSGLQEQLDALQINNGEEFDRLLKSQPASLKRLLQQLRINELNEVRLACWKSSATNRPGSS